MNSKLFVKIGIIVLVVVIIAVAAVLTVSYFRRPTVGELVKYNRVENLAAEKGSVCFSAQGMEISFMLENDVLQSATKTVDLSGSTMSVVQYDGLRYTVSNSVISVTCQPANHAVGGNEQTVASFFGVIEKDKYNARPKKKNGKYVYEYQPPNSANRFVFTFNEDKSCDSIDDGLCTYTFTYGWESVLFK